MSAAEGTVVHAYGLIADRPALSLPGGVDGAPVTIVRAGEVSVLVSELSAKDYGPEVWRAHAEDPQWLEHVARQHHAVLQAMVEQTDVLPLRLPGIHPDVATLEEVLGEQETALVRALEAVLGHVELGAKVFLVDEGSKPDTEQRPTSGRDYLARRSAEATRREDARLRRQSLVLDAHESMAHASTHAVANPPQDPALSGRTEPMLLNAAYLVPRERMDDFVAVAEQIHEGLAADGMTLEVSGPWPPYNFAATPDDTMVGQDG